ALLHELPENATIGTGSLRRQAQLREAFGHRFGIAEIRGNVDTRIKKLDSGEYHGIILAAAGLMRLGLQDKITEFLDPKIFIPSTCQGVLAIESLKKRAADFEEIKAHLYHEETAITVSCEREFLKTLKGGCKVPIAGYAQLQSGKLFFEAAVYPNIAGKTIYQKLSGFPDQAKEIGARLAENLLRRGADKIIREYS
ncbi:hydroxymethylbilane synthase, partial [Candidatus Riflebacteria bacterium]